MMNVAEELRAEVEHATRRLGAWSDAEASAAPRPGGWSRKEILGHLIDSAANNHQRIVRAQLDGAYRGPGYQQDAWVALQRYREREWTELIVLWASLNQHLSVAMAQVLPQGAQAQCVVGDDPPCTLDWLMHDYLRHLRHHLAQME